MKKLLAASLLALGCSAGTAQAATTFTTSFDTTGATAAGTAVYQNFNAIAANTSIGTNTFVRAGTTTGMSVAPAVGSTGNYAAVEALGTYTTSFAASNVFSFVLGSLDAYNTLVLNFADGSTSGALNGAAITGAGTSVVGHPSGTVTYRVTSGSLITGATFTSGQNAFEFDNLASAVPEPAAWGMMILGFGLVGGVMRRRSAKVSFA
jgi:hypothetical protein